MVKKKIMSEKFEPRRMKFMILTTLLGIIGSFFSSLLGWGWTAAAFITFSDTILFLLYIYRYKDWLVAKMFLFGLFSGMLELLADQWLVNTKILVYSPNVPLIIQSPFYMPFAWANVIAFLCYIGSRFSKKYNITIASLLTALASAIYIPIYEQLARNANWWYYKNAVTLGAVPLYIIGGEFFLALTLPAAVNYIKNKKFIWSSAGGVLQGIWIWLSYLIALAIVTAIGKG